jgi:hypothetical protein
MIAEMDSAKEDATIDLFQWDFGGILRYTQRKSQVVAGLQVMVNAILMRCRKTSHAATMLLVHLSYLYPLCSMHSSLA